jgi:nucleotide-binding universal stress UspA family protein
MSGVILVVVEHPETALATLAAARRLAGLMGHARINVLAVRAPSESSIMPTEEILTRRRAGEIRNHEQARMAALGRIYDGWATSILEGGITAEWADIEGPADALVEEWGCRADYLVLNRPGWRDNAAGRLTLQAALFATDRPVLVAPPGLAAPFGECVAIAWRDDRRTIRSVLPALRLLDRAREVHVLTGVRPGSPPPRLPTILAEHGIAAILHVLEIGRGVFGAALLAEAHRIGADLMVMGAYTHSPWRELVLGGVTRHLLANADLALLMRH